MFKMKQLAGAIACVCAVSNAHALVADGKFGAGEYSDIFAVDYNFGSEGTHTGFFAFGSTGANGTGNQFIYFAAPKEFVDNSYDLKNSNPTAAIGWNGAEHTLNDKLLGSDTATFVLQTANNGKLDIKVDYIATNNKDNPTVYRSAGVAKDSNPASNDDITGITLGGAGKADGKVNSGDASVIQEIATSLEWNLANIPGHMDTSPTADGSGITDKNNPDYGSYANPENADWIYEVGYEIEFAAGTFDTTKFSSGLATDATDLFTLGTIHASPHKIGRSNDIVPPGGVSNCDNIQGPKPDFCGGGGGSSGGSGGSPSVRYGLV